MSLSSVLVNNNYIFEVSNLEMKYAGTATMAGGVATVNTAAARTTDLIYVCGADIAIQGPFKIGFIADGVSFQILSSTPGDAGQISWVIIREN